MAYRNLYKPLSQFVDPMSTEISEGLRKQFLSNYQAVNAVESELAMLQAAPFPNDKKMRNDLVNSTTSLLANVARRGDYENMTIPVMNASKKYQIESAPIRQNYELYTTYQTEQEELYKEGEIDYEQYLGNIALSNNSYTGLSQDESGRHTNYFTGVTPINTTDDKIQKRMHDALNGIVAEEFGSGAEITGINSATGQVKVLVEGEIKTVSNRRVREVMNMLMSDRQIQMYMQRKGQIRAVQLDDNDLFKFKEDSIEMYSNEIAALEEEIEKTTDKDKKAAYEQQLQGYIAAAGKFAETNDTETLRGMYAATEASGIEQQFRSAAANRYGYYTEKTNLSVLPEWAQLVNGANPLTPGPSTAIPGLIAQTTNPSGSTFEDLSTSSANQQDILHQMEDLEYMQNTFKIPLTGSEILEMTEAEFQQAHPDISVQLLRKAQQVAHGAVATKAAIDRRINEIKTTLNLETGTETQDIKSNVAGAAEMLEAIAAKFNVSENEAVNMLVGYVNTIQDEAAIGSMGGVGITHSDPNFVRLTNMSELDTLFGRDTSGELKGAFSNPKYNGKSVHKVVRGISSIRQNTIDKIDDYLEDNSTITTSFPTYDNMPFGFALSKAEQASLEATFTKSGPPPSMTYYDVNGNLAPFEDAVESMGELFPGDFDAATAEIASVRYSPYDYSSAGATIVLTLNDDNEQSIQVTTPMSQVQNSGIDRYLNSNINRFAAIVGQQYSRQVEDIIIPLKRPDGKMTYFAVDIADTSKGEKFDGTVQGLDKDGKKTGNIYTIGEFTDPNPANGILMLLQKDGILVSY